MSKLLEGLNKEQMQAVTHTSGPLLIVAGAGTGKTTVITRRIAYLIEQKLARPDQILALTFTDKAAGEMEERVDQLLPLGSYDLWISTFHSFCERILKQHAIDIGLPNDFELLDPTRQWVFMYRNFSEFNLDYYRPIGSPNKFIDAMLDHFSKCKDELISPEDYLAYVATLQNSNSKLLIGSDEDLISEIKRIGELAEAYRTYQRLMIENGYLDFGDLINYTIQLLKRRPNLLRLYQEQFMFIMVDEFQDTNLAQYELIKLLSQKTKLTALKAKKTGNTASSNDSKTNNLVVVGDDDQSIYKFRGASVSNILKLKKDFPDIKDITLIDNYRSSQAILDLAYNFIQANNPNRLEIQLKIDKRLRGHNTETNQIQVIEGSDLSEELNLVIAKTLTLKEQFPDSSWNDFCILIRSNSAANEIVPILEAKQIPYSFVANRGLYKKPLIADIINYLKLLDNYHESSALYRVLNYPKFHLDAIDVAHLTQFTNKKALSLFEAMQSSDALALLTEPAREKIQLLIKLTGEHTKLTTEKSAVELFVQLISDLGIDEILMPDTLENAQNRELLEQFYKKIEEYCQSNDDRTMRGFLSYLQLEFKAGEEGAIKFDPNSGPESLKVMTIHGSKGLEFKFVFIINLVDQRFPTRGKRDSIELPTALVKDILPEGDFHLQEERRLFYVALTRAKTHLYLSWGRDYGGAKTKKPSLFLFETDLVPSDTAHKATGKVVFTKNVTSPRQKVYHDLPTRFSFSQIYQYLQCPLEYKYRYYLRLPLPGSQHLSFGSTIHSVLEQYLKAYQLAQSARSQALLTNKTTWTTLPPESLLYELYEKEWIDDWYESKKQKEEYRARGKTILHTFYEGTKASPINPHIIERSFSLKLGAAQQYTFNGKIDRADMTTDGLMVIDYKTSEKVPKKSAGNDVDQLRVYQWACEEYFQQPVAGLQYWYLHPNELLSIPKAKPEELEELKTKLLSTIEDMRHSVEYDTFAEQHHKNKQHNCNYADLL